MTLTTTKRPLRRAPSWAAALALVAGAISAVPATAATTVVSLDFESGSYAPLIPSGVTASDLAIVDVEGGKALQVSNRANDYSGVQTAAGTLEPGASYQFSVDVKLADGVPDGQARLVGVPGYTWIGTTAVSSSAWTTISGAWTVPNTAPAAETKVYIGTSDLEPAAPYSYLIDNFTITTDDAEPVGDFVPGGAVNPTATPLSQAQGDGDVVALTFDDGPNPGETEALLDVLADHDIAATFCVIGQNIATEEGTAILKRIVADGHALCNHSTSYADMGAMTADELRVDMIANLGTIRTALGDPDYPVPYFRAPNGSWGADNLVAKVAAELGMQPLGLGNLIEDWTDELQVADNLEAKLRDALQPGAVVLGHDGGGQRDATVEAYRRVLADSAADWQFTLPVIGAQAPAPTNTALSNDFEETLDPWSARGSGEATASLSTDAHQGAQAALVSGRTNAWNGLSAPAGGLQAGAVYNLSAAVKLPAGADGTADIRISVQRAVPDDAADKWVTLSTITGVTSSAWTPVNVTFTMPADPELIYFETSAGTADFLVDSIVVSGQSGEVQDLTPIKDTVDFPVGVAIDQRETTGEASELLLRHFDQITPENHMKPEAWYDAERNFSPDPQIEILMDYAQANGLGVYGHVLVWHSQTPEWFFQDDDGRALTNSDADKQFLRDRLEKHIVDIADYLSDNYGAFGSDTNPLVAWDVVNEVISDDAQADGLRRSEWYRILGPEFIDLAFEYAEQAFNVDHAAPGVDRPVTLFINDYNTEYGDKQARYRQVIEGLLARDIPIDGVGHQFHVSLSTPVTLLAAALERFSDLPLVQAITELDVGVGGAANEALLIEQGHYYRDAFNVFRDHSDELFSVTLWGLTDGRSWRSENSPLAFTDTYQAKQAYYGIVDSDELASIILRGIVFQGTVDVSDAALDDQMWDDLPLRPIGDEGAFQARWAPDQLSVYLESATAFDAVRVAVGDVVVTVPAAGADGAVVSADGTSALIRIPGTFAMGQSIDVDVTIVNGDRESDWNPGAALGVLRLVEPLSVVDAPEAGSALEIDGLVDRAYADANVVTTDTVVEGDGSTASAQVRTLWRGNTLYALAEVTDPEIDLSASNPWERDSVEFFIDMGNAKNGSYRGHDMQVRLSADNEVSFGTGDPAVQQARITSATGLTETGYVVEIAIDLGELGGAGTVHGFDVQVNDGSNGARIGVLTWADPTGLGYQNTERWGVVRLVAGEGPVDPTPVDPSPTPVEPTPTPIGPSPKPTEPVKPKPGLPSTGR